MLVGMGSISESVCLFVRSLIQQQNDPQVFKLGIGNDLGISYK